MSYVVGSSPSADSPSSKRYPELLVKASSSTVPTLNAEARGRGGRRRGGGLRAAGTRRAGAGSGRRRSISRRRLVSRRRRSGDWAPREWFPTARFIAAQDIFRGKINAVFERAVWIRSAGQSRGDPTVLKAARRHETCRVPDSEF